MESRSLSPAARQIEAQLEQRDYNPLNPLQVFLKDETHRSLESRGLPWSDYDVYVVRRNKLAGEEVFGPKTLHAGEYSEELLYGATGSQSVRFRSAVQALCANAQRASFLNAADTEYGHQVALVWAELGRLKEFMGTSPEISELVAELRTARFQFLGTDTPPATMKAVASALRLIAEAPRLDPELVDRVVAEMEAGGVDSLAPDTARAADERCIS